MYRAARDAGYSHSMAKNASEKIMPGAREEFMRELACKIPQAKLIRRIAEGLDAKQTKLAQFQGDFTDHRHMVDWSERRRYAELIAKLLGLLVEKVEVAGRDEQPPPDFNLNVVFVKKIRQIYGLEGPEEACEEKAEPAVTDGI